MEVQDEKYAPKADLARQVGIGTHCSTATKLSSHEYQLTRLLQRHARTHLTHTPKPNTQQSNQGRTTLMTQIPKRRLWSAQTHSDVRPVGLMTCGAHRDS